MNIALCISENEINDHKSNELLKRLIKEVFLVLEEADHLQTAKVLCSSLVTVVGNYTYDKEKAMTEICTVLMKSIKQFEKEEQNENI